MTMSSAMRKSLFRTAIIGVLALVLGACTAVRFGYNQGPELAYWWLDRYLDFDDTQEARAREAIAEWFRWHRATQLPDYAGLLASAAQEADGSLTPERMCRWVDTVQARVDTAFDHAAPALADAVRTMTPDQVRNLERKYAKNLKDYKNNFMQPDPKDRRRAQVKRVVERAEMVYGQLNDAQRQRIEQLTDESPLDVQAWYTERQRRQQDVLAAVRKLHADGAGRDEAIAVVRRLYGETFRSPREAHRHYQQRLVQYNCAFAAQVHNLANAEQRAHAVKRLRAWEEDARALAAQGR
jgi:hypothetical protein